jgi:PAS domain S-box-containing protein
MRGEALRVLLVDDEASLRKPLARYLSDTYGYQVDTAADGEETWERVLQAERPYDVALIDNLLPPEPGAEPEPIGIDLMRRIKERCPETEVIIFTGGGMERALEALRAGAYRYLAKPLNLDELGITILMAAEQARLRQERDLLSATLGISRAMISGLDIGKTLEVIAEAVPKLAGAEAYAVARITPATGQVRYEPVVLLGDKAVRWCRHLRDVELTRQIIESGETFTLPDMDARTDEVEVDENLCRAGVKSFIGVPISGEPQNLGVLYAYSTRREAFGTREQQVLQLLADQAGIAIANAQAFAKLEEHAGHMEALVQAGQGLTKTTRVEDQLSLAWEFVQEQLKVATFFVALYDKRADVLRFPLFYDKGRPIQVTDLRLGDDPERWGITGYVVKTGQELYWPTEESSRAQCRSLGIERFQIGKPCQSCFFLPLKLGDKVVGSISVQSYNKHAFTPTLLNACRALGSQLSEALGNARLFSELVEAKEWQEALIENAFDAVIAIDQNKRITVFNQRAEEMFGWRAREMIGQTVVRLHMDVGKAKEIWDVVSREGAVSGWEVELKHRDGTPIPALLSATLIRESGGRPIGREGFIRDLRRVNLLEERLRALIRVSQTITSTLELDEVLERVIQAALTAFPMAQQGAIHLHNERANVLYLKANTFDYSPSAVEALCLEPGEGIAGWVFQHQRPLALDDAHQDPRYKRIDHPEVKIHKSMACVPLEVRGQVIGILSLDNLDVTGVFQADDLGLLSTFADQAAIAIDNARLYQEARRRQQLLTALDEASRHIRAEKETLKLLHEVVRLAAWLVNCETGCLFINHPHLKELELSVTYELSRELIENRLPHAEGLVGLVARTGEPQVISDYSNWPDREAIFEPFNFKAAACVPLKHAGEVEAVLLIADSTDPHRLNQSKLEILERFAVQAAIALQASRLMSREQRMFSQLDILHHISDYIQAAGDLDKILHVVLTGVTAGYGLGFNRAALLLFDERHEHLAGRMGIGHQEEPEARRDWDQHHGRKLEDFRRYLELLEQNALPLTPVGERIRRVRLPAIAAAGNLFGQAVRERQHIIVTQNELDGLPEGFVQAFEPAAPFIIAPLMARDQVIGLLVADNKFTESPITPEDEESLLTFVNTAAIAIDNAELITRNEERLKKLEMLSRASHEMVSNLHSLGLDDRLNLILRHVTQILDAEAAAIFLVKRPGFLSLEASYGHRDGGFQRGKQFPITSRRGAGLTGYIARTGKLFNAYGEDLVTHWATSGKEPDHVASGNCYSLTAIPLKRVVGKNEKLVGLLKVENKKDTDGQPKSDVSFTEEDEWILSIFAETVVICLENAELYERTSDRLEKKVANLQAIQETSAAITAKLDLDELLKFIAEKAASVFAAPAASLMLWDDREENLLVRAKHGLTDEYNKQRIEREQVDATIALVGGLHPLPIVDLRSMPFGRLDLIEAEHLCSMLSTPLVVSSKLFGILNVYSKDEPRQFTSDEIEVAEVFAGQAAVAIRNAQLYDETIRRASTLETLCEAGKIVISTLALDQTLSRIVEQAWRLTGQYGKCARFSDLELVEGKRLRVKAAYPPEHLAKMQRLVGDIDLEHDERVGITGQAVKTGQYQLVNDIAQEPDYIEYDPETRSELAMPIKLGEEVIGVINVEHPETDAFDEQDQQALEALAAQAALAVRNAQLYQQRQKRIRTLQVLYQAGRAITSTLELQETLDQIVEQAMLLIEGRLEGGCLSHLALVEGNVLHFAAACTLEILKGLREKVGDIDLEHSTCIGITGRAVKTRQSQNVGDVNADPDYICFEPRTLSELAVPIKIGEQVIGVINVEHPERDAFSADDRRALESLAAQAAIAIRNARQSELSRAIYEASKVISTGVAAGRRELLNRILEQAATHVCWPQRPKAILAHIQLYDATTNELQLESIYPQKKYPQLVTRLGERRSLDQEKVLEGRIGISGRAILEGKVQRVSDVRVHRDYVGLCPETLSELDIPLRVGDRVLGVLGLESDRLAAFDEMDERALQSLAELAVIAVQNAELYQKEAARVKELSGLHHISQTIRSLTDIREVYQQVNESIATLIGTEMCAVLLCNEVEEALICQLPMHGVPDNIGLQYHIPLDKGTAAAIWEREDDLILNDVERYPLVAELGLKKLAKEAGLRDTMLVKLVAGKRNIGVVQASNKLDGTVFNQNDARLLRILAGQAAAVIENARLYEDFKQANARLRQIKGFVGTKTAVDWMRMVSTAWGHSIKREVGTSLVCAELVRHAMQKEEYQKALEELQDLERKVQEIKEIPITAPLSAEDAVTSARINRVVETYLRNLWRHSRYSPVQLDLELRPDLDDVATVRASEEWLRRGIEIIVDNAVQAMLDADSDQKRLLVETRLIDGTVEILVCDTGPGISEKIKDKLIKEPIDKPKGSRGAGIGLVLAGTIFEAYRGNLAIRETGPAGTLVAISLPVENDEQ